MQNDASGGTSGKREWSWKTRYLAPDGTEVTHERLLAGDFDEQITEWMKSSPQAPLNPTWPEDHFDPHEFDHGTGVARLRWVSPEEWVRILNESASPQTP